jgi:NAD(P)-dependent dehydrogenase (short-subunit alcohol dehydrogenase family)
MKELAGKVVLITGAGRGSGKMLAREFAARGAIIAANDISPVNVEEVVNEITRQGGRAKAYIEDVAKKLGAQNIVKQVEDDFGRLDILINHAAVEPRVPLLAMDEWDWHRVLDVNLTGTFLMTQSAGRVMREQGWGVIISLITEPDLQVQNEAAFVASMQGLEGFTRQAAHELSLHGIRVHAVKGSGNEVREKVFALLDLQTEEP